MAYKLKVTGQFKKNVKLCKKRGLPLDELWTVLKLLLDNGKLPIEYKPHKLSGNRKNQWECHIRPDWLLVWMQDDDNYVMLMLDTGTHSDIFSK